MNDPESHPDSTPDARPEPQLPPELPPELSPELSPELAERLREACEHRVFVPKEVDDRIALAARAHLADVKAKPQRSRWQLSPRMAAAAAVLLAMGVAIGVLVDFTREPETPHTPALSLQPSPLPGDVNGDGVVDVIDAHRLALRVQRDAERAADTRLDVNRDGEVDRHDADALAMLVVDLAKEAG